MRQHEYVIQKGEQVPATFVGTKVVLDEPTTMEEAVPRFYENQDALIRAANAHRRIACNRASRDAATKEGASPETIRAAANAVKIGVPREASATGGKKPTSERAVKAAKLDQGLANVVNKGEAAIKQAIALGFVTQEDVDAYRAAVAEKAPATEQKPNSAAKPGRESTKK